ncbi:MAG TPA: tetratricopeptide repeat protein [Fimbriiglobus sp.]
MSDPLLVRFYEQLPKPRPGDDPDLWAAGVQDAMREFRGSVRNNYAEGTLIRLVAHPDVRCRQAVALALGLTGTMTSNAALAGLLKDEDPLVQRFAHDAMWEVWLRGQSADACKTLREALQLPDFAQSLAALDDLIDESPEYAEAYNQRAILLYRRGEYARSIQDCEVVLRLNPHHFGAAAGIGQCYLRMKRPRSALRAFRHALDLFPGLDTVQEAVQALSAALGESD